MNERQHETRPNLQDVLDALPFPSIVIDAEHRVLLANPAAVAALGVGASNCDRRCFELVHCSERPPPDCPLEHAEVSGGPEVVELDQGDDTWVRASVYPLPGLSSTGQRLYLHTLIDTTAEHRSRRTLAESEERYRILAETAQDMIFIIDADDRIEYVNKTAAAQFGLTPEELMGRQRSEVFPRRLAAQQKAELAEVLRSGTPMTTESATRFGDRTAWLSTSLVPLTGDDGAPRAVLGISRDFTSRRNAEEELRATTHRFEELFELSPTISYTEKPTEEGFRTNWVSRNLSNVLGYDVGAALEPGWWARNVHPDDVEQADTNDVLTLAQGWVLTEYRFRHADGRYRWLLDERRLVNGDDGKPREIVGAVLDITEKKSAEAALKESERQLQQSQRMEAIANLAGGIAHDFNNRLTAIGGYADLLLAEQPSGHAGHADLLEVRRGADAAADLVRQLLAFSRRQTLMPRPIDLNDTIRRMSRMLERILGEDVSLETLLTAEPAAIEADPSQIEQVILNLVSNARGAMPYGGRVMLETSEGALDETYSEQHPEAAPGEYVILAVTDTGTGMVPEVQARAFEPFFTTKPQGAGTGLGLSTVYGIVRQSGGQVTIHSKPEQGTTIRVYLPKVPFDASDTARTKTLGEVRYGGTETILVVEDEPAVLRFAERVLLRLGYTVLPANSPAEAFDVSDRHEADIHLLLSDVVLPEMGGRQVSEELTQKRDSMRTLFMSGYTKDAIVRDGRLEPGITLLQKPFTPDELANKVRSVLDQA